METAHCIIDIGLCTRAAIVRKLTRLQCPLQYGAPIVAVQYTTATGRTKMIALEHLRPEERLSVLLWAQCAPRAGSIKTTHQETDHAAQGN